MNRLIAVGMVIFLLAGCGISKQDSLGRFDEILVFADSSDWVEYRDALASHFMKEYLTPVPEVEYLLKRVDFKDFNVHKQNRNIMFLSTLNGDDAVSREIVGQLSEEVVTGVKSGDYFYIPQENAWALNQYVVYLVAPTRDEMLQRIYDLGELVYDDFEVSYYKRLKKQMFSQGENTDLSDYIANHFPFRVRVQHDYQLVDESLDENYIWLRRLHPERDRSLTIQWIDDADSIVISSSWLIRQRNRLAAKIHAGDVVVEEETHAEEVRFKRWQAMRLEGTWKNPGIYVGGPFRTIAFREKSSNKIYILDFYIQAIGQRKKPYLDQLDIITDTFTLEPNPAKG